ERMASRWDSDAVQIIRGQLADPSAFDERRADISQNPDLRRHDEIVLKDGRTFDRYTAPLYGPDGTSFGRAWFFRDVTEARRTEDAQRLMLEASMELDASLDLEETLAEVAHLTLRYLADWCTITLLED